MKFQQLSILCVLLFTFGTTFGEKISINLLNPCQSSNSEVSTRMALPINVYYNMFRNVLSTQDQIAQNVLKAIDKSIFSIGSAKKALGSVQGNKLSKDETNINQGLSNLRKSYVLNIYYFEQTHLGLKTLKDDEIAGLSKSFSGVELKTWEFGLCILDQITLAKNAPIDYNFARDIQNSEIHKRTHWNEVLIDGYIAGFLFRDLSSAAFNFLEYMKNQG
ncbi:unnamed protein product [Dimorphilus gyrociliatus]|uniref:Uncharacterized protein n=1 Tax=Dimorphilus gyrociliatus TaxID=2664684 RepID=A0A7I8VZY3_9ANNE|nr:unnamed protein product [Dimorphilus gyrociliatus]